jgi:C1A family cysteine protease/PKD repeat protein
VTIGVQNAPNQNKNSTKIGFAPENPEFVKYQNNKIFTQAIMHSQKKYSTGFVPAPVDLNRLSDISNSNLSSSAYYNSQFTQSSGNVPDTQSALTDSSAYDLRNLNRVTTVKDQGHAGVCWAFATYGSLESFFMPSENWDFSENNMKNLLSSAYPDGFDRGPNDGGNEFMSTAYLTRWNGSISESDDPYSDISTSSPTGLTVKKHAQDVLFLPDRQGPLDNGQIKSAVQNYGAVFTTMYYDDAYYSPAKCSYYYGGSSYANHAIDIVGWNDSFDKHIFLNVPPGNGAFIIKNSWGTGFGETGYFYVSYYDSNIGTSNCVFTAESPNNYKTIYQYDPLGWTQNVGYGNPTAWCANVFTTKSDETLKAVSFYTTDSNSNYVVYVYTNLGSSLISQSGSVLSESGTSTFAGYHTIPLNTDVQLKAGQKFSIVLKLTTPGCNYPIAVETPISDYSSKATANPGQSFISSDGNTWHDITGFISNTNVCIKAFTIPRSSISPLANFSASSTSGNAPLTVTFTDNSANSPTSWSWNFGDNSTSTIENPSHMYTKAGTYTVSLTATNAAGSNIATKSGYIVISALNAPVASFSASATLGTTTRAIVFTDTSTNTPTSWSWNFGDNSTTVKTKTATHTFTKAGTYTVTLTVMNSAGSSYTSKTSTVVAPPVASFTVSPTSGSTTTTYTFTDTSTNTPTSWSWKFGDGGTATTKSATHKYVAKRTYTVSLAVTTGAGSVTVTKSVIVTAGTTTMSPVASFTMTPAAVKKGFKEQFTDTSTNIPTKWKWTFGDGTSISALQNPTHVYTKTGTFKASMIAYNAGGSNTLTKTITVS